MKGNRAEPSEVGIAERALRHARDLAFPRMVGSGGERAARRQIVQFLEQSGYTVEKQRFRYVAPLDAIVTGQLMVGSLLVLIVLVLGAIRNTVVVFPILLILALLLLSRALYRSVWRAWVRSPYGAGVRGSGGKPPAWMRRVPRHASTNLLASLPGQEQDTSVAHLYLIAHYDSKSQWLPLPLRVLLFVTVIVGALSFVTLTMMGLLVPPIAPIAQIFGAATLLATLPLILLRSKNDSPGAVDNASGVGLALSLAAHLASDPHLREKIRISFLFAGAEEAGNMGAAAFVARNNAKLKSDDEQGGVHALNIDGIGSAGKLHLVGGGSYRDRNAILELVEQSCREARYPLGRFPAVGVLFDHVPFAQQGYDSMSLVTIGRSCFAIHTAQDTRDRLSGESFERAGGVLLGMMEKLAEQRI